MSCKYNAYLGSSFVVLFENRCVFNKQKNNPSILIFDNKNCVIKKIRMSSIYWKRE